MIITKKAIPRRTVLRGLGAAVALPLLDGMVPAYAALRHTAAKPTRRLGVVYVPHGAVMDSWTPAAEGADFEFTPILAPLAPFRDRLLVLTGLDNQPALALKGEPAGGHGRIGVGLEEHRLVASVVAVAGDQRRAGSVGDTIGQGVGGECVGQGVGGLVGTGVGAVGGSLEHPAARMIAASALRCSRAYIIRVDRLER